MFDINSSTLSPIASGRNTIDYGTHVPGDDSTTQDMSRVNAYKSAAKLRMHKKGSVTVSPSPAASTMKPIVNSTWDNPAESTLPVLRGAHR